MSGKTTKYFLSDFADMSNQIYCETVVFWGKIVKRNVKPSEDKISSRKTVYPTNTLANSLAEPRTVNATQFWSTC